MLMAPISAHSRCETASETRRNATSTVYKDGSRGHLERGRRITWPHENHVQPLHTGLDGRFHALYNLHQLLAHGNCEAAWRARVAKIILVVASFARNRLLILPSLP